jgi:hypothetical protein
VEEGKGVGLAAGDEIGRCHPSGGEGVRVRGLYTPLSTGAPGFRGGGKEGGGG